MRCPRRARRSTTTDEVPSTRRFTGEDLDGLDLEELLSRLSDLLLGSGFDNPYGMPYDDDEAGHSMQTLHDAILEALLNGGLLSDEMLEKLLGKDWRDADDAEERLDELIDANPREAAAAGLPDERAESRVRSAAQRGRAGGIGGNESQVRFEITDKSLDFLGYRALRDLLGSIGKSSLGRHDTREMATGVEASGAPKPYEFGDTMNLDASGTILNAVVRTRVRPRDAITHGTRTADRSRSGCGHRGGLRRSDGRAGRVSELVRDGADARLQPQHDPLR